MTGMEPISLKLARVEARLRAAERRFGRRQGSVQLLAVSKGHPAESIAQVYAAGQRCFGESYLQEAIGKMDQLAEQDIEWHFIGRIQGNKTRVIAERFAWVHGLCDPRHARRLNDRRPAELPALNVCLQIDLSGELQKAGVAPEALDELATGVAVLPRLRLRGLMVLPAPHETFDAQREPLRELHLIFERLVAAGLALDTLSMGMSNDLEAAVAEGSTIVRVGTAIFGPRQ